MKLLIIGLNYRPEETGNAPYTTGLAEYLVKRGHSVTVLAGIPSYPEWEVFKDYRHTPWKKERVNGVEVRRRWHYVPHRRQSAFWRGVYESTFLLTGLSALLLPRPDLVLGVVPPLSDGALAKLCARRFGVPYGLIFQDLVGRAAAQAGVEGGNLFARPISAVERWIASRASGVGIVAQGFRSYLESIGVRADRILSVRNWTHVGNPLFGRAEMRDQLGLPRDAVVCLHAGNMGYKQGLETLVECARLSSRTPSKLLFVLSGGGSRRTALEQLVSRYALENVRFLPVQELSTYPSLLAASDILLVAQRASVIDMSLPSKLTSYFAAGKPVVAAVGAASDTAREIVDSGGGILVAPEAPDELIRVLRELERDPRRRNYLGARGKAYAREALSPERILANLETFIQSLSSNRAAPIGTR